MKCVEVRASRTYQVLIEPGLLQQAGQQLRAVSDAATVMLVSDDEVWMLYGAAVQESLERAGFRVAQFVFPHGESAKCASTYLALLNALCDAHLTRKDAIAALGGGVVGDLAGFAAATYLRGIGFFQLPTSLLAMVDSSVGGKTAIDLPAGKNLAGAFYQPQLVLCDPDCLSTLPEEIFRDGCAEVIKYAILADAELFAALERTEPREQLPYLIETCVRIKRDLVAQDEFDRGARQLLNLGHTFGHAIEACSCYAVTHGAAVAVGMAMMLRAAAELSYCKQDVCARALALLRQYGFYVDCPYPADDMLHTVLHDKKADSASVNLIVPTQIGSCQIVPVAMDAIETWLKAGGAK